MDEASQPPEGEDVGTTRWEDARHWLSIYADLLEFRRGILERVRGDVTKLEPVARRAAEVDVNIIEGQLEAYQKRLELWSRRTWDLLGLQLDPAARMIRYKRVEATLSAREFQLLQFLLDHPGRHFTVSEIISQAWADPNLVPEEARNHVEGVRKVLVGLGIPCDLVHQPGRGYSLELREDS